MEREGIQERTYTQDWKAYTASQTNEMRLFSILLKDLLENVEEPEQKKGRPRLSLKETLFCTIHKVYSQLSSRRAHSLYRNAEEREQIRHVPSYNTVNKLLNRRDITAILNRLLRLSALPLKGVEETFATDSSGFRTSQFSPYATDKWGRGARKEHKWVKLHLLIGCKTNVIVSARVTKENVADSPKFRPMVNEAHRSGFKLREVVADRAYSSKRNLETVAKCGGDAYIPFRSNVTGKARGSYLWSKMFRYFQYNREEFMKRYHARSNVETCFFMLKAKFGDKLKSKKWVSQKNELLCKLICHNVCVVIQEMYELGISPSFSEKSLKVDF